MAMGRGLWTLFFPHRAQMSPELDVHSLSSDCPLSLESSLTPPSSPFFRATHCSTNGGQDHRPVGGFPMGRELGALWEEGWQTTSIVTCRPVCAGL